MRILVANRGEIARRVVRTAHFLGHETVAVFADPDRGAPHVAEATSSARIGPADLARSYLSVEAVLGAAARTGASAVHPGYGLLAEHAGFARAVLDAGLTWIGPSPDVIEAMGSKVRARRLAVAAGVAVIPGFDESQQPAELAAAAAEIGYPVLIKASAGGGGKGIRVVAEPAAFAAALLEATTEAARAFGDDAVIVERFVRAPRHVEVQLVGDVHGGLVELGTRECSLQRRYQKVIEEAPAPNLPEGAAGRLRADALRLGRSVGYDSAGTVEFVVDGVTGEHFFLEMNTRLQVEHTVTEQVTGLDLVELMIRSAAGEPLPIGQDDVVTRGHAFEARLNAEDPHDGFAPRTGAVAHLRVPAGVRWESGVETGSVVTPHYDPLLAKLVTDGPDRATALRRLGAALDGLLLAGVPTNAGLLRWLVDRPEVQAGAVTTRFLDELVALPQPDVPGAAALAAAAWTQAQAAQRATGGVWARVGALRLTPHRPRPEVALDHDGEVVEARPADRAPRCSFVDLEGRLVAVNVGGATYTFGVPTLAERWASTEDRGAVALGALTAPFPGVVVDVRTAPGRAVEAGEVLVTMEAMKMLHSLTAPGAAVVAEVRARPGQAVDARAVLVTFEQESP